MSGIPVPDIIFFIQESNMRYSFFNGFPSIIAVLMESFSVKDGGMIAQQGGVIYPTTHGVFYIAGDEIFINHKVYRNVDPETVGTDVIRSRLATFYDHLALSKPYVITRPDGSIVTVDRLSKDIASKMNSFGEYAPDQIFPHFEVVSDKVAENVAWLKSKVTGPGVDNKLLPNYLKCPDLPIWARHPGLVFFNNEYLWYRGGRYHQTETTSSRFVSSDEQIKVSFNVELDYTGMMNMEGYLLYQPCAQLADWYKHTGWGVLYNKMLERPDLFGATASK